VTWLVLPFQALRRLDLVGLSRIQLDRTDGAASELIRRRRLESQRVLKIISHQCVAKTSETLFR
jgi:hypothetical protein